jgi:subfamily B ATP-binding cassette protein MsbA
MSNIEILKRLYKDYTSKFLKNLLLAVFFSIIVAISTSSIAWLLDPAIKKLFIEKDQKLIIIIPIAIIISFATKGVSLYFAKIILVGVAEEVKKILQFEMLSSFIKADTQYIDTRHSGKSISNLNFDVEQIKNLLSRAFLILFKDGLTLIGLLIVMFYQNWKLSIIAMIMIPLASLIAKKLGKRMGKVTTEAQVKSGDLNKHLIELFKNHKLIKIFQREEYEESRSEKFINALKEKSKKIEIIFARPSSIMETLTGIVIAIIIFFSGKLIFNDEIGINNFFSFLAAMMLAYQPVRALATLNLGVNQGISAGRRILPIIDYENKILANDSKPILELNNADIKFNNVNYSYDENKIILKNINIEIEGGKMNAFVGLSGAGKSTLLNLIPRIYDKSSGDITIDNQSIYEVNLASLRSQISVVDQNTTLFDDTIFNNIIYAKPDATQEEVFEASKLSMSEDFIKKLDKGFNTLVGENGIRLSGGEKQRISIARAFLRKSKIILLDEPTSSLDSETEDKIQIALKKLTENKTTIVIAHRLSTVQNSNKIFVIDSGKVVSIGTHKELLNNSDIYNNFYNKQIKNN